MLSLNKSPFTLLLTESIKNSFRRGSAHDRRSVMKRDVGSGLGMNPDGDLNTLIVQRLRKAKNQANKAPKESRIRKRRGLREWAHRVQRKAKRELLPSHKTKKNSSTVVPKKTTKLHDSDANLHSTQCKRSTKEVSKIKKTGKPKETEIQKQKEKPKKLYECVSCLDKFQLSDIPKITCSHLYCQGCITKVFELFIEGENSFPPQCCGKAMESTEIQDVIGLDMAQSYEDRKIEFNDPKKTYCSNPNCSRYILPRYIRRRVGTCEHCLTRTCVECGKPKHSGYCRYENDVNDDLLEEMAKRERWQRCSKCSRIIERISGCFHIS